MSDEALERTTDQVPLELEGISKCFRGRAGPTQALSDVNLTLQRGELLSLVGPNGAGKSTTLRIIAGLMRPDFGRVRIFGSSAPNSRKRADTLSVMLDGGRNLYPRLTLVENLEYFAVLKGLGRKAASRASNELLERFGLHDKANESFQGLSTGMQQRAALVCCLVHRPKILVLDEPTVGLDYESQLIVIQMLGEFLRQGVSILLTTHQFDLIEKVSSRIAFIKNGVIASVLLRAELDALASTPPRIIIRFEKDALNRATSQIRRLGLEVADRGRHVDVIVEVAGIYELLGVTRPATIVSVERVQSPLADAYAALYGSETGNVGPGDQRIQA